MLSRAGIPTPLPVLVVEWDLPLTFDDITKEELIIQQQHFSDLLKSASTEGIYALLDGILVPTKKPSLEHAKHPRVVLPPSFRQTVICNCHEQSGHAAVEWTMFHIAQSYVWPGMYREIKTQLEKCLSVVSRLETTHTYSRNANSALPPPSGCYGSCWTLTKIKRRTCLPSHVHRPLNGMGRCFSPNHQIGWYNCECTKNSITCRNMAYRKLFCLIMELNSVMRPLKVCSGALVLNI